MMLAGPGRTHTYIRTAPGSYSKHRLHLLEFRISWISCNLDSRHYEQYTGVAVLRKYGQRAADEVRRNHVAKVAETDSGAETDFDRM